MVAEAGIERETKRKAAMTLRIIDCKATPNSITVFFSDAVNASSSGPTFGDSARNLGNYSVQQLGATGAPVQLNSGNASVSYNQFRNAALIIPPIPSSGASPPPPWPLTRGNWIGVTVSNVETASGDDGLPGFPENGQDFFPALCNGDDDEDKDIRQATRAAEDAVAFPLLTEEVGYAPSPLARPPGAPSGGRGLTSLGQTVTQAVSDVLGWKIKPDDPKGFVGALTASFTCADVEGHTQCTWTPRTYAVQTDLSGGITGAQASLYSRAQDALNQSLPLLDGLYPLDPEADSEDVAALKGVARSQLTELVNELGLAGGPRVDRVNQYFQLLLQDPGTTFPPSTPFVTDPDQIKGTLGSLRDELGLNFTTQDFVNTVQDEQDLSNFRILSDYVTSLAQSWINNLRFFGLTTATPFFGTQLVVLSRQLSVVAESVDEVRFTLDSVFIGPAERQTLELRFDSRISNQPLFAEDLFNWIQSFATEEGPRLIQDGGKYAVRFSFLPIAQQLQKLVKGSQDPNPLNKGLPPGFHTFRVQRALKQLGEELDELVTLASPISHVIEEEPTKADFDAMRRQLALLTGEVEGAKLPPPPVPLVAIPPALNFLQFQPVNTESPPQFVTLFNVANSSVTIKSITIQPSGPPSEFAVIEPIGFPIVVGPQSALHVSIAFTPTTGGNISANLVVIFDNTTLPSIPLSGTGQ
jgi:hypothetical protein